MKARSTSRAMRSFSFVALPAAVAALVHPASHLARAGRRAVVPSAVNLEEDAGGLKYVALTHPSGASAKVFLYGADVTSYVDADGTEWIAVRPDAKMDGSKPISGGLSHCFPQFGPGEIQQHGFARNVDWAIADMGETSATFELTPNKYTREIWDKPFACQFKVALGPSSLDTTLTVVNTGRGESFDFQAALHSYLDVSSIGAVKIAGSFEGSSYLDKMADPPATCTEARKEITIAEEYDRVYMGVNDPVLKDSGKKKLLKIVNSEGYADTVLWNPYGNDAMGYEKFVCVESVKYDPVPLAAGETWSGVMSLVPEPL
uniref:glucose-6-phosphate 1-epimerase n=1 Tax=Chrysocystis fragilis TaxID=1411660 RepID=A0A7S0TAA9_9STRA